jgi:cytochrome P450
MSFQPAPVRTAASFEYPSEETLRCPYDFYEVLRDGAPVHRVTAADGSDLYLISRHEDVFSILRQPAVFSSRRPWLEQFEPEVEDVLSKGWRQLSVLISSDPPEHTRVRRIAAAGFTPRRIRAIEDEIVNLASKLIDGFIDRGEVDLVTEYAEPLPVLVIAEILGVPPERKADLMRWSDSFLILGASHYDTARKVAAAESIVDFQHFIAGEIAARREQPGDDYLSDLIVARHGQEGLSDAELIDTCRVLIIAGHETTTQLIGNSMLALLNSPDQFARLREEPALGAAVVEETMRYDAPAQRINRYAAEDVEVAGVTIPAGSRLLLMLGSTGRDECAFPGAARFEISRDASSRHLGFGFGPHFCLGAPLARAEARITLELIAARLTNIRVAAGNDFAYKSNPILRGLRHLYLEFDRT